MLQLHLGCGKRFIPSFVHIDLEDFPHIDYRHNIASLPMFEDDSVDLIYSSHSIEYFDRIEVMRVLIEWRRVLKVGGKLRLAVPDFEALVEVYKKYANLGLILGPLYGMMEVKNKDVSIYHKTVYDYQSLARILQEVGFNEIDRYDWRKTLHRDYDDFSQAYVPHMDKENGTLISLNIEAKKMQIEYKDEQE